jgi:fructose-1,6-bisphosphatase-3
MELVPDQKRYLKYLARKSPSQEAVAESIISMQAQLELPKGTEHFISDIPGEYEAFCKVVSHASGAIKRKLDEIFKHTLSEDEKIRLGSLIYQPETVLGLLLPDADGQGA